MRKDKVLAETVALLVLKKSSPNLGGQRGRLITAVERCQAIELIEEASVSGARRHKSCEILCITMRTLERWEKEDGYHDKRASASRVVANKLSEEQREEVLTIANSALYQDLSPSKIVPLLADAGYYIASEATFYQKYFSQIL